MATLDFKDKVFTLRCRFDERDIPREAGFHWDPATKTWYTRKMAVAARLREHAIGEAKAYFDSHLIQVSPWPGPLPSPPEGLSLLPHQKIALDFALGRNRAYLALDMRLGKTVVAALTMSARRIPTVVLCPPFLFDQWCAELQRWSPGFKDWLVIRDSRIGDKEARPAIEDFLFEQDGLLIVDEAHRYKNADSQRAKAFFELIPAFSHQIYLSGTPMPNRPLELFPILSAVAPETIDFMGLWDFGRRYCAGHKNDFGWDFSGASHVKELAQKVIAPTGPFMLRQRRDLVGLPPVHEELFVVSADMSPALAALNSQADEALGGKEDLVKAALAPDNDGLHLATYRRMLGAEKANAIIPYIEHLLDETTEKLLIFAHHKEVVASLATHFTSRNGFMDALVISADMRPDERAKWVRREFQERPERRMLIGSISCMGMGLDCSKADRVIFVEFDWVPGVNDQAAARALKLGKTANVYVQYVVYKNSIDKKVVEALIRKRKSIALI